MIRFENISISFGRKEYDRNPVLRDVDFRVESGEFVCLLGASGCGKSTLLNLAAGFLVPDSGRIVFDGTMVSGPRPERGMVFQEPTLFPWLTVFGNVAFGLRGNGLTKREIRWRVEDSLRLVGLEGVNNHFPHTISGGMRQRVALARVLVLEPNVLLLDEPFSSLDANSREALQNELLRIWQAHRRTMLFVTHSVPEAAYLADRVILMAPPPASIRGEVAVTLERPRDRTSESLRKCEARLRNQLDGLISRQRPLEAIRDSPPNLPGAMIRNSIRKSTVSNRPAPDQTRFRSSDHQADLSCPATSQPGTANRQRSRNTRIIWTAVLLGLFLILAPWWTNRLIPDDEEAQPIQLAYQNRIGSAACIVAVELELFLQQESIAVKGLSFNSGPACAESLYSGSADIGTMGDTTAIITASRGGPYRILGSHGSGEHRHRLVAREAPSIRAAADLVGQTLAVKKGTSTYGGLLAWLEANNVDSTAIRILDMRPSEMPDALAAGSIDAFAASEPTPSLAEMRGAKEVVTFAGLGNQYPILILANSQLLASRPAEVKAVLRSLRDAIQYIKRNPAEAAEIVGRATGLPPPVVERSMRNHDYDLSLNDQIMESLRATARFLKQQGAIQRMPDFETACDGGYLPE